MMWVCERVQNINKKKRSAKVRDALTSILNSYVANKRANPSSFFSFVFLSQISIKKIPNCLLFTFRNEMFYMRPMSTKTRTHRILRGINFMHQRITKQSEMDKRKK